MMEMKLTEALSLYSIPLCTNEIREYKMSGGMRLALDNFSHVKKIVKEKKKHSEKVIDTVKFLESLIEDSK